MKKAEFESLIGKMDQVLMYSTDVIDKAGDTDKFENLSVKEARDVIDKAKRVQSIQDQLLTADLYHIIGMGNLNAAQLSKFNKIIGKIGATRAYIKKVATTNLQCVIPGDPKKECKYECKILGITLTSEH